MTTDDAVMAHTVSEASGLTEAQAEATATARALVANMTSVVRGADEACRLAVIAILANGHLLIEDVPGVGKTMLAKAMARSIGATLARIQGHPDLLPSDITGVSVYNETTRDFEFRPGPVFAHVVLVDELNRTPPRSQAALLESMEERQVSVDGHAWPLPDPHLVLATQNPVEQAGTYPLVESQMDRFLLAVRLGYPDARTEAELALRRGAQDDLAGLSPATTPEALAAVQRTVAEIPVHAAVAEYAVQLVRATREVPAIRLGASPRATIGLLAAARAAAVLAGRGFVSPGDIQAVAPPVLGHRLVVESSARTIGAGADAVRSIVASVPTPRP